MLKFTKAERRKIRANVIVQSRDRKTYGLPRGNSYLLRVEKAKTLLNRFHHSPGFNHGYVDCMTKGKVIAVLEQIVDVDGQLHVQPYRREF